MYDQLYSSLIHVFVVEKITLRLNVFPKIISNICCEEHEHWKFPFETKIVTCLILLPHVQFDMTFKRYVEHIPNFKLWAALIIITCK